MRPSLANLGKSNPLHFRGLRSGVTNFSYGKLYGVCIVVESTVNHFHYVIDATIIWISLSREIQGLCFYVWFVRQITDSNCLFLFTTQMHVFSMVKKQWLCKKFYLVSWTKLKLPKGYEVVFRLL